MDDESAGNPYLIEIDNGSVIDLGPLIKAANAVRRNALLDSEFDAESGASPMTVAAFQMGMRVAVVKLFGDEAATKFDSGLS